MTVFSPADILLPKKAPFETWAVIACDQFTSQPEYWAQVRETVQDRPSTLHLILPESELGNAGEPERIRQIHRTMLRYEQEDGFRCYENALIYVERTLRSGAVRKGLIGKVDLEAYDYRPGAVSPIRATEKTVTERIPPRMRVRRGASIELPHVILLCDDGEDVLIGPIADEKDALVPLYDFELMQGGGHIRGWLVPEAQTAAFVRRMGAYEASVGEKYADLDGVPMVFAVGDGNHSLATAKACYEEMKKLHPEQDFSDHPARYALVELENIHEDAQVFEPIHRVLTHTQPGELLDALRRTACAPGGYPVSWVSGRERGTVYLDRSLSALPVGVLQQFLDGYLASHPGQIDYIHGDEVLESLSQAEGAIGFRLPPMEKRDLFRGVIADGALPRKTFSMGHAQEKRYYLEGRRIQP